MPFSTDRCGLGYQVLGSILGYVACFAGLACAVPTGSRSLPEPGDNMLLPGSESETEDAPVWLNSPEQALAQAKTEYKPVFLLFGSEGCAWCERTRNEVLKDSQIDSQLRRFVCVRIDIERAPGIAAQYIVQGVPAFRILSAEGRYLTGADGYLTAPELLKLLRGALDTELLERKDTPFLELLQRLEAGKLADGELAGVVMSMADPVKRIEVRKRMLGLKPFPAEALVDLLQHKLLAVRLGALDLLEEGSGSAFGFDPWATGEAGLSANRSALQRWQEWMSKGGTAVEAVHAVLSEEQIASYLRDLISEDQNRAGRAARMLQNAGESGAQSMRKFLEINANLPRASILKVREVLYGCLLPPLGDYNPEALAHRLLSGNLETRLGAIALAQQAGRKAMPVFRDALLEEEPLLREAGVQGLFKVAGSVAVPDLVQHLQKEKDMGIVHSILNGFGEHNSGKGQEVLRSFVKNEQEELAIVALQSLGRSKSKVAANQQAISSALSDPRWRVRAAALDAIALSMNAQYSRAVFPLLDDPDEFVRFSAVHAIAKIRSKEAAPKLEKLFHDHDDIKGPVVQAFAAMELPFPASFGPDLKKAGPEVLLSVIGGMDGAKPAELELIRDLCGHSDTDVACAALRLIASRGMSTVGNQNAVVEALRKGPMERQIAVLENLSLADGLVTGYRAKQLQPSQQPSPQAARIRTLEEFFLRRENNDSGKAVDSLFEELERIFSTAEDHPVLRFHAACLLLQAGNPLPLTFLEKNLGSFTSRQREALGRAATRSRLQLSENLLSKLLQDSDEYVRGAVANAALRSKHGPYLEAVLDRLYRIDSQLHRWELDSYYLVEFLRNGSSRGIAGEWVGKFLGDTKDPVSLTFGLLLARFVWPQDAGMLVPFYSSRDALVRRAAYFALARNDPKLFAASIEAVAQDPSAKVRAVLPSIYRRTGTGWIHYFSEDHSLQIREDDSGTLKPPPAAVAALELLLRDSVPAVRLEAFFTILGNGIYPDPAKLRESLHQIEDAENLRPQMTKFLISNYLRLNSDHAFLLDYVEPDDLGFSKEEIFRRLGKEVPEARWEPVATQASGKKALRGGSASPVAVAPSGSTAPDPSPMRLLYFANPGCHECERVEELLEQIRASFPKLAIDKYNLHKTAAAQLYEALAERFQVPERRRLIAPALFSQTAVLIREDIDAISLGQMLNQAAAAPSDPGWFQLEAGSLESAGNSIAGRLEQVSVPVILGAGLLDGINPCAFATIILFLSYLQVARRSSLEILAVGCAFVLGVFLTYFALGIGMLEVVSRLQFLRTLSSVITWLLAGFVLVVMVLNLRDGLLCLQGRLQETALQLPGAIKDQVRKVVRTGTRHRHFVVAAFVSGVLISFLELACTGQVYAPTIYYMVRTGNRSALGYLLVYNLAFIVPLLVIFGFTFFGLNSSGLVAFQQKHTAMVKFATAALFLALFVVLVWR